MNELVRIVSIGLIGGMLSLTLKRQRPEFAVMTALVTSAIILTAMVRDIKAVLDELQRIVDGSGVDIKYFAVCVKAAGTAYTAQFAAEILRDSGEGAIAAKVEAAGKIAILVMTLPVMESLMDMCIKAVNTI